MENYLITMIVYPNAKINLGLSVISKRPDGYHNLNTIFYPIPLFDALEFVVAEDGITTFSASGIPVEGKSEDNLVLKAYYLLNEIIPLPPLKIHLHKNIPMGAGLGGGSSDAAFLLKTLNTFFSLKLSNDELETLAKKLGADCAFFIYNNPCLATERGDCFKFIEDKLKGYFIVLVKPDIHVSTALAYSGVVPKAPKNNNEEIYLDHSILNWKNYLFNDFEDHVFINYPRIKSIKDELYKAGALYSCMSGSGSTVFGIFENEIDLTQKFEPDCFIWSSFL